MRRLGLSALLGAAVLLAGLRLEHVRTPVVPPAARPAGSVLLSAPAPSRPADTPRLTVHQLRAYLRRNHIAPGNLDIASLAARVEAAASANRLEPALLLAVIRVESTFQANAVSERGALGLMQIQPVTGAELAAELGRRWEGGYTLFDPDLNIDLGARYLRKLIDRFDGDQTAALQAYCLGPTRLESLMGEGVQASLAYADRVRASVPTSYGLP